MTTPDEWRPPLPHTKASCEWRLVAACWSFLRNTRGNSRRFSLGVLTRRRSVPFAKLAIMDIGKDISVKTLSEAIRERTASVGLADEWLERRCRELLESVEGSEISVYVPSDRPIDPTDYTRVRESFRAALRTSRCSLYDLACDHCGTQLINDRPGEVLMSYPPQEAVGCPGCGFTSSI